MKDSITIDFGSLDDLLLNQQGVLDRVERKYRFWSRPYTVLSPEHGANLEVVIRASPGEYSVEDVMAAFDDAYREHFEERYQDAAKGNAVSRAYKDFYSKDMDKADALPWHAGTVIGGGAAASSGDPVATVAVPLVVQAVGFMRQIKEQHELPFFYDNLRRASIVVEPKE